MEKVIASIKQTMEKTSPAFSTEENKIFMDHTCKLFATRKAGMAGKDFIFIHNLDKIGQNKADLEKIHEEVRKYANSFFKLPKWIRLSVPNIVSVFISSGTISPELINWSQKPTRSIIGGEIHSIYFIDLASKTFHGQGTMRTPVYGAPFIGSIEFKKINPQNRSFYLMALMMDGIFNK